MPNTNSFASNLTLNTFKISAETRPTPRVVGASKDYRWKMLKWGIEEVINSTPLVSHSKRVMTQWDEDGK